MENLSGQPRRARGLGWRARDEARSGVCRSAPRSARLADSRARGARAKDRRSDRRRTGRQPTPMRRIASPAACRAAALDFMYGDAFPHETNMDRLHGVDFDKGCYVGQEVVSRMQHRGTARTRDGARRSRGLFAGSRARRFSPATSRSAPWARRPAGNGLALIRIDRVADALDGGTAADGGRPRHPPRRPGRRAARAEADRGMTTSARLHADGMTRCPWPGEDPFYMAYHDTEWGVPEYDDRALYREADPRRLSGRAVVDHDPAQARQFPQSLRRFRAGEDRALQRRRKSMR